VRIGEDPWLHGRSGAISRLFVPDAPAVLKKRDQSIFAELEYISEREAEIAASASDASQVKQRRLCSGV
jgi:hypothetical protein